MKKALVLGATGGMGYAIVKELTERGIDVVAFARNKEKLESLFSGDRKVERFQGDVFEEQDLWYATENVDVVFHAINIPYNQWGKNQPRIVENILRTVKDKSIKLAMVDNIYAYGRQKNEVTESSSKNPHTKKGQIRLELERMVRRSGVPAVVAHFPDFYGPNAESSFIHYLLKDVVLNKKASFVGKIDIPREYIFTPDGAKAIVELAIHEEAYGQNWNIPATDTITGEEILQYVRDLTGYEKSVSSISTSMIRMIGLINPQLRELTEMMYLTEKPVVLSGAKYEKEIGVLPRTPYKEGLKQTLEFMKKAE